MFNDDGGVCGSLLYAAILLKCEHCTLLTFFNFMIYRLARSILCLYENVFIIDR